MPPLIPILPLPKSLPALVEDDCGGGFSICDAVGARDWRIEYVRCILGDRLRSPAKYFCVKESSLVLSQMEPWREDCLLSCLEWKLKLGLKVLREGWNG
jgi:hypothetical protein